MSSLLKRRQLSLTRRPGSRPATAAAGFTLLEVLVATAVLGIGIAGVLVTFSAVVRATSAAEDLDDAVQLAGNQLELAVATGAHDRAPSAGRAGRYSWNIGFAEKPHGLVAATVTVAWSEGGRPQTFRLSELFRPDA